MRKLLLLALICTTSSLLFAQDLSYYLPKNVRYNPSIPTPPSVIGH